MKCLNGQFEAGAMRYIKFPMKGKEAGTEPFII